MRRIKTITVSLRFVLLALLLQFALPVLASNGADAVNATHSYSLVHKHDVKLITLGLFEKTETEEENKNDDCANEAKLVFGFNYNRERNTKLTLRYTNKSGHLIEWPVYLKILVFRI